MRFMGWTYRDLLETPPYVVRYCTDLMVIRQRAEADHAKKAQSDVERRAGHA